MCLKGYFRGNTNLPSAFQGPSPAEGTPGRVPLSARPSGGGAGVPVTSHVGCVPPPSCRTGGGEEPLEAGPQSRAAPDCRPQCPRARTARQCADARRTREMRASTRRLQGERSVPAGTGGRSRTAGLDYSEPGWKAVHPARSFWSDSLGSEAEMPSRPAHGTAGGPGVPANRQCGLAAS